MKCGQSKTKSIPNESRKVNNTTKKETQNENEKENLRTKADEDDEKKMISEIEYVMSCIFSLSFMHSESKVLNHRN